MSDDIDRISEALGRLSEGVKSAHRQNEKLEQQLSIGIARLEANIEKMLIEVRTHYHEQNNNIMAKLLHIESTNETWSKRVEILERWQNESRGATRVSHYWITAVSASIASASTLLIEWLRTRH
jgi:hypothetical protein